MKFEEMVKLYKDNKARVGDSCCFPPFKSEEEYTYLYCSVCEKFTRHVFNPLSCTECGLMLVTAMGPKPPSAPATRTIPRLTGEVQSSMTSDGYTIKVTSDGAILKYKPALSKGDAGLGGVEI